MWVVLGFFILHIFLTFNTGYKDRNNDIIYDRYKIARNYMKGGFEFDLLVSFPFVLFEGWGVIGEVFRDYHKSLFLLRLLRIFNIMEINESLNYIADDVFKSNLMLFFFRLLSIICVILCVAHVGGCIWFKLGENYVRFFYESVLMVFSCLRMCLRDGSMRNLGIQ